MSKRSALIASLVVATHAYADCQELPTYRKQVVCAIAEEKNISKRISALTSDIGEAIGDDVAAMSMFSRSEDHWKLYSKKFCLAMVLSGGAESQSKVSLCMVNEARMREQDLQQVIDNHRNSNEARRYEM